MKLFRISSLAFAGCMSATITGLAQPSNLSSWKVLAEGGGEVEIAQVAATPPVSDGQSTNALQITVKQN